MLAAEKHKATFMAPIGIGLTLFVCQLFGTLWTGCGMNPARSFGPSVVAREFVGYHWIYWVGPLIGSLIATFFYSVLKALDYGSVVLGQDADTDAAPTKPVGSKFWHAHMGFTRDQRKAMLASGMKPDELERAEAGMVAGAKAGAPVEVPAAARSKAGTAGAEVPQTHPGFVARAGGRHPSRTSDSTLVPGSPTTYSASEKVRPAPSNRQSSRAPGATSPGTTGSDRLEEDNVSMGAEAQDEGGLTAPGTHHSGLRNFAAFRSLSKQ